jgi:hypothetical protein
MTESHVVTFLGFPVLPKVRGQLVCVVCGIHMPGRRVHRRIDGTAGIVCLYCLRQISQAGGNGR